MPRRPSAPGYRFLARLGGGPHAEVFAAEPSAGGGPVAVKVLRDSKQDDAAAITLIRREARAGLAVRHPNLVAVAESHVAGPPYFFVMPLVPGHSAKQRVRAGGSLALSAALSAGRQAAEALAALHAEGYIHGDVKSDNLRLASGGRAVLVDLGFAHRPGELNAWAAAGHMMGTPNYIAPELCEKPPDDTTAADVFSLGVTLYELLTGELPYPSGAVRDVIRRRRSVRAAELVGDWPAGLPSLVAGMTDPDPTARPEAKAVAKKLLALQVLTARRKAG